MFLDEDLLFINKFFKLMEFDFLSLLKSESTFVNIVSLHYRDECVHKKEFYIPFKKRKKMKIFSFKIKRFKNMYKDVDFHLVMVDIFRRNIFRHFPRCSSIKIFTLYKKVLQSSGI